MINVAIQTGQVSKIIIKNQQKEMEQLSIFFFSYLFRFSELIFPPFFLFHCKVFFALFLLSSYFFNFYLTLIYLDHGLWPMVIQASIFYPLTFICLSNNIIAGILLKIAEKFARMTIHEKTNLELSF